MESFFFFCKSSKRSWNHKAKLLGSPLRTFKMDLMLEALGAKMTGKVFGLPVT